MLENFDISKDRVQIVAEIGNNHEGNFDLALELIEAAAICGVDAVKFQTFIPEQYVTSLDVARLERLRNYQFTIDQFRKLSERAGQLNLTFFSTPFDLTSALLLNEFQTFFKISSGDNNFFPLIEKIATFDKPTMISTGLADMDLLKIIFKRWNMAGGKKENLSFMHCVSSYPAPLNNANLSAIVAIRNMFPENVVGYSDHTLGNRAAILAAALGAKIIEKHFTLNKSQSDFRDHQLSADPAEMTELVRNVREVTTMLGDGRKIIQECERDMVVQMRRSLAASRDLMAGHVLKLEDLTWVRPGTGMPIGSEQTVLGRVLSDCVAQGQLLEERHFI